MFHKYSIIDRERGLATNNGNNYILERDGDRAFLNYENAIKISSKPTTKVTKAIEEHYFINNEKSFVYEGGIDTLNSRTMQDKLKLNRTYCLKIITDLIKGLQELQSNGLYCRMTLQNVVIEYSEGNTIGVKVGIHNNIFNDDDEVDCFIETKRTLEFIARLCPILQRSTEEVSAFSSVVSTLTQFMNTSFYSKECLHGLESYESVIQSKKINIRGSSVQCNNLLSAKNVSVMSESALAVAGVRGFTYYSLDGLGGTSTSSTSVRLEGTVTHLTLISTTSIAYIFESLSSPSERYLGITRSLKSYQEIPTPVRIHSSESDQEQLISKGRWLIITGGDKSFIYDVFHDKAILRNTLDTKLISAMASVGEDETLVTISFWDNDTVHWSSFPGSAKLYPEAALKLKYEGAVDWKLNIMLLLNDRNKIEDVNPLHREKRYKLKIQNDSPTPNDDHNYQLLCLSGDGSILAIADSGLRIFLNPRIYKNETPIKLSCYNVTSLSFLTEDTNSHLLSVTCEHSSGNWLMTQRKVIVYRLQQPALPVIVFECGIWKTEVASISLQSTSEKLILNILDCMIKDDEQYGRLKYITAVKRKRNSSYKLYNQMPVALQQIKESTWSRSLNGSDPDMSVVPIHGITVTVESEQIKDLSCLVIPKDNSLFIQPYDLTACWYNFPLLITQCFLVENSLSMIVTASVNNRKHSILLTFPSIETRKQFCRPYERRYDQLHSGVTKSKAPKPMLPKPEELPKQSSAWF